VDSQTNINEVFKLLNNAIKNRIIKIDIFDLRLRKLVRIFALLNHSK
jgi:hypothetical protein